MPAEEAHVASSERYDTMIYRRCGRSGLLLPAISLGLWLNFGDNRPFETGRKVVLRAFDAGITHFDLANNYGPPYGAAERNLGQILGHDLRRHRDELVISTKAGYDMWPGPYGDGGSRKYLIASIDQSLQRLGVDYVDIFYSHRVDPKTPLEETMAALGAVARAGKALYVGLSSYPAQLTLEAVRILRELGAPVVVHQPSYSLLNRWIEEELLDVLQTTGLGCVGFSALAQGLLSERYLDGVPPDSRAARGGPFRPEMLNPANIQRVRGLANVAHARGQSLPQMAIAWTLRDPRLTSALTGASTVEQLEHNLGSLANLEFSAEELEEIDRHATEANVNIWRPPPTETPATGA